jgi:hypothetical protein
MGIMLPPKWAMRTQIAYSGAEDGMINSVFNGDISLQSATVITDASYVHTGIKSVMLAGSQTGFAYVVPIAKLIQGKDYSASVWLKAGPGTFNTGWTGLFYQIDGTVVGYSSVSGSAGGWYLVNIKVPASALTSGTTLRVGCFNNHSATNIYFDDFRFQPANSGATAYVYDQFTGELTHILDNNNLYIKFEYDGHGRLIKTYRETLSAGAFKTNEYEYNYCQSGTLFSSALIDNQAFTPQCPPGQVGTPYYVTVPAGQFTSGVSQADADLMAQQ